jgi:TorA maturation chaperone TorD
MNMEDRALVGQQRSEAYSFLSTLFANPLDANAIAHMASAASQDTNEQGFANEILNVFRDSADQQELATRLAVEHTRLFCGISEEYGPPPPYESLWREGLLMGDSTVQVASHYVNAGYGLDGQFSPCDHLADELRFMAALCKEESEACNVTLPENVKQLRSRQLGFLDQHLMIWVGEYCRQLADLSKEPLYQALARVTATVLEQDATHLRGDLQ